ncbi:MAG: hypothetical protein Q9172_001517 [Xanthocarpia lactea]
MHFFKSAAYALTVGLALVDARAINKKGPQAKDVIVERGHSSATPNDLKPRWTNRVNGEKLNTRALFGLFDGDSGDGVEIAKSTSQGNAKACSEAIDKLRKARKLRKRADDGDYEMSDEPQSDGMDLGPKSHTVSMGNSDFIAFDDDDETDILGTVGLNSCTGVLIVGKKGAVIAHLDPIEDGQNQNQFKQDVADKVTALYNANRDRLGEAPKMYAATPSDNNGEKAVLESTAGELGIDKDISTYEVVEDDDFDDEYIEAGKGAIWVNFKDRESPKVVIFGNTKN